MKRTLMVYDQYEKARQGFQRMAEMLALREKDFSCFHPDLRIVNVSDDVTYYFTPITKPGDSLKVAGLMLDEVVLDELSCIHERDVEFLLERVRYVP